MFGKNDDDQQDDVNIPAEQMDQLAGAEGAQHDSEASDGIVSIPPVPANLSSDPTPPSDNTGGDDWQHPGTPINDTAQADNGSAPAPINDVISPYSDQTAPTQQPSAPPASSLPPIAIPSLANPEPSLPAPADDTPAADSDTPAPADENQDSEELADIKQKALDELSPLVDKLDQSPEDKFRTVMMMIQASDDQNLVPKAYEVAHSIEDEKVRAQALLDIVNEINYFTQHSPQN